MSLPLEYTDSTAYLKDVLTFLKKYQWLYNYPNTDVLINNVIEEFPKEWVQFFFTFSNDDLNDLPTGKLKEASPRSLEEFFSTLNKLKPPEIQPLVYDSKIKFDTTGIGQKKLHEIISLAPLVDDFCRRSKIDLIIDVGSGRGYLSQVLHSSYGYKVLGIEGSGEKVALALKYQEKYYKNSKSFVKYVHHFILEESDLAIESFLKENFQNNFEANTRIGITGLHACADLSVVILRIFLKLKMLKTLVVMPCCYHRISVACKDDMKEDFNNFPASDSLKLLWEQYDASRFLRTPFLRLACQERIDRFKRMTQNEHEEHSRCCLYRAILEVVAREGKYSVSRLKRKTKKPNASIDPSDDFESYLNNLKSTHTLICDESVDQKLEINDQSFKDRMLEKWKQHKGDCYMVEVLTAFQAAIQSICENIVLLDRVEVIKDNGLECYVQKVTDDVTSPRCYALAATKP